MKRLRPPQGQAVILLEQAAGEPADGPRADESSRVSRKLPVSNQRGNRPCGRGAGRPRKRRFLAAEDGHLGARARHLVWRASDGRGC